MKTKLQEKRDERRTAFEALKKINADTKEAGIVEFDEDTQAKYDTAKSAYEDLNTAVASLEVAEKRETDLLTEEARLNTVREPTQPATSQKVEVIHEASPWDGPAPFADFLLAVRAGSEGAPTGSVSIDLVKKLQKYDAEVKRAATGMGVTTPSEGGFLVAPEFRQDIMKTVQETGVLVPLCTKIPVTNSAGVEIPAVDETTRAGGVTSGGLLMYWKAEAEVATASQPKIRSIRLEPEELIGHVYVTNKLLNDASALETFIKVAFPEQLNFQLDIAITRGTGAGQPLGILNCGAAVSVAKESDQPANTVVTKNITKMFARMYGPSRRNAVWLINQDVLPQLLELTLVGGTASTPMMIAPGMISNAPDFMLLGRPVKVIEQCSTVGTVGDIIFTDLKQYLLAVLGGLDVQASIHVRFLYRETAFQFVYQVDGQPWWSNAITPYQGSNTVSPIVTLASRD